MKHVLKTLLVVAGIATVGQAQAMTQYEQGVCSTVAGAMAYRNNYPQANTYVFKFGNGKVFERTPAENAQWSKGASDAQRDINNIMHDPNANKVIAQAYTNCLSKR